MDCFQVVVYVYMNIVVVVRDLVNGGNVLCCAAR